MFSDQLFSGTVMHAHAQPLSSAFSADRRAADWNSELRRELMNLAEPIIADRIIDGYRAASLDGTRLRLLAGQHRRLWRAILLEHRGIMEQLFTELRDELADAGVRADLAEGVDQGVFEELVEIVLWRFRSSNEKAKQCSMILLGAASFIGAARGTA